jgi:hypothetical protein
MLASGCVLSALVAASKMMATFCSASVRRRLWLACGSGDVFAARSLSLTVL